MKKILSALFFAFLAGCGGGDSSSPVVPTDNQTTTEQRPGDVAANTPRFGDVPLTGAPVVAPAIPPVVEVTPVSVDPVIATPIAPATPAAPAIPEVMLPPIVVISNPNTPTAPPVVLVPTVPTPPENLNGNGGRHCGWQQEDNPSGWNYIGNNYYYKVDPTDSSGFKWKYVRSCENK